MATVLALVVVVAVVDWSEQTKKNYALLLNICRSGNSCTLCYCYCSYCFCCCYCCCCCTRLVRDVLPLSANKVDQRLKKLKRRLRSELRCGVMLCCAALRWANETKPWLKRTTGDEAERDRQSAKSARGERGESKVALSLLQPWGAACCMLLLLLYLSAAQQRKCSALKAQFFFCIKGYTYTHIYTHAVTWEGH